MSSLSGGCRYRTTARPALGRDRPAAESGPGTLRRARPRQRRPRRAPGEVTSGAMATVLFTGFPGFLGSELLPRVLARDAGHQG